MANENIVPVNIDKLVEGTEVIDKLVEGTEVIFIDKSVTSGPHTYIGKYSKEPVNPSSEYSTVNFFNQNNLFLFSLSDYSDLPFAIDKSSFSIHENGQSVAQLLFFDTLRSNNNPTQYTNQLTLDPMQLTKDIDLNKFILNLKQNPILESEHLLKYNSYFSFYKIERNGSVPNNP